MDRISVEEFRKVNKKTNKYRSEKTAYNGKVFDSKKEADFAKRLDWLKHAKSENDRVVVIEYQPKYPVYIKNKHVFTYISDFRVVYADKHEKVFDVKGYKSGEAYSMFKLKAKCVEAFYNIKIIEI